MAVSLGLCWPLPQSVQAAEGEFEGEETSAAAESSAPIRVIPGPAGARTSLGGASSAPVEINHGNSIYFTQTDFFELGSTNNRVLLRHYPVYQETGEYAGGPAAALTVLYYFGNHEYDEPGLAGKMNAQSYPAGTQQKEMVQFFRNIGWSAESSLENKSFERYEDFKDFVLGNLHRQIPILVENAEWGGCWKTIIGYDSMGTASPLDDMLIFAHPHDTADHRQDGYTVENGMKFFSMWFDRSMLPEGQRQQPWITAHPSTVTAWQGAAKELEAPYRSAYDRQDEIAALLASCKTAEMTDQLLLLIGHNLSLWNKDENGSWQLLLDSYAGYGEKGLSEQKRAGDRQTPVGAFPVLYGFGIEANPGTSMEYRRVTAESYLSGEKDGTYNTWVESPVILEHSEHLADTPENQYGIHIGYNSNPAIYGAGSGIFLRVKSPDRWSTDGGLSVTDFIMRQILKGLHNGAYIIMVPYQEDLRNY